MVKKTLVTLALLAALVPFVSRSASAQDKAPRPVPAVGDNVLAPARPPIMAVKPQHQTTEQPTYCNPCLFYGGDFNPNSSNADGFANGNTNLVPATTDFVPFTVPTGIKGWKVNRLFTNNLSTLGNVFDPKTAMWSISVGPVHGVGFKHTVASGTGVAQITATGRSGFGFTEYDVEVGTGNVFLLPGAYWLAVLPQCTNPNDANCSSLQYFLTNTDSTNAFGPAEPQNREVFNSTFFGFNYAPLCTVNTLGCNAGSAGVVGTVVQ